MNKSLDIFRFKAWLVNPEPYICYLTGKIHQVEAKNRNDSWFWEEPGHLYCFIFVSLFGHHVEPKYRCLLEAYQRCDLGGLMVAQEELLAFLKKMEPADGVRFPPQLLIALMLCGVEEACAKNPGKVTKRGALLDVILGELGASASDKKLLTDGHIKAARATIQKEKSQCNANAPGKPGVCSGLSPAAAEMFPDTFKRVDEKVLKSTQNGSMKTLKAPMDPHSEWQRIAAGPHPLSIFETAWILIHFRLRDVHSGGL